MKNNKSYTESLPRLYKLSAVFFGIFAVITAAGYFLALKNDFSFDIGHFENGSLFSVLFTVGILLSAVLAVILFLVSKKKASVSRDHDTGVVSVFLRVFAGVMAAFVFVSTLSVILSGNPPAASHIAADITVLFIAATMMASCIPGFRFSLINQILSSLAIVSMAIWIFTCYFDQTLPLNSPVRTATMLAQISLVLFLTAETRLIFGFTEKGGISVANRASLPYHAFASGLCGSVTTGFSLGALVFELTVGGHPELHPSIYRLAMYVAIGILALIYTYTMGSTLGEYVPTISEKKALDSKKKAGSDTDKE